MECEHLEKLGVRSSSPPFSCLQNMTEEFRCAVCHSTDSIWLCVSCGTLSCGRYVNAHGLKHREKTKTHAVSIETKELSVFCYDCDEFIVNDTPDRVLDHLRSLILRKNLSKEPDSDVGGGLGGLTGGRCLRPRRKRTLSNSTEGSTSTASTTTTTNAADSDGKKKTKGAAKNSSNKDKKLKNGVSGGGSPRKRLGLKNLGNTCFMNSVLQSLSNIEEFCNVLTSLPSLEHQLKSSKEARIAIRRISDDGIIVTEELKKVLMALKESEEKTAISPESLFQAVWKVVPRFRGYQQQDAHEFLRYMLDRLHTELLLLLPNRFRPMDRMEDLLRSASLVKSQSMVTSVFGGTLQSEVTCLSCRTTSKKHDPFLDLSVDIPQQFTGPVRKPKEGESPPVCHIHDCLQKFVETEELADSERFFCNVCKSKQPSTKKFWIRRLPNVLCLHVKRFRWTAYARTKLDIFIEFPLNGLDMSGYLLKNLSGTRFSNAGSSLYDLAAVIVHHGTGAGSGHYTAFATNNQAWYHFNDCSVRETDFQTVSSSKAYILFYVQREFNFSSKA